MFPRRAAPLALLLALAACAKEVKQGEPQATLVFAAFASDATNPAYLAGTPGPKLPQPSDLALQAAPLLPASAQKELLQALAAAGGFPSDQEVTITIPVRAVQFTGGAYVAAPVPDVDTTTVAANALVLKVDGASAVAVPFEVAGYAKTADGLVGTITLRKQDEAGSRRWAPGRYVVALRGGASGVKTTGGLPLDPDQAIALVSANRDLSQHENQPPGGLSAAQVQSLEGLRATFANPLPWCNMAAGWLPVTSAAAAAACTTVPVAPSQSAFAAVSAHFPLAEVASIQTFSVAPAHPVVLIDAGSGVAPLPIDLLRTGAGGTIANNPAFGPAAAGLTTLDGFSTTAMMLAQTSAPIDAATVTGANVFLYKLDAAGGAPTRLLDVVEAATIRAGGGTATPAFLAEPPPITQACPIPSGKCSAAIGLQPAVGVPLAGPLAALGTVYVPPLQQATSYAVVVTNRVKSATQQPLARSTVAKILLGTQGALYAGGNSLLAGVDAATAQALQTMRAELAPVLAALPAGTTAADVATAYTFRTQSIAQTALRLSAAPYSIEATTTQAIFTPDAAPTALTVPPTVPTTGVAGFYDVQFKSVDAIDKSTGALRPTLAADLASATVLPTLLTELHALVAVPDAAAVPLCPSPPFPAGARCAKLVVFGHGLNGSKEHMLAVAASLAARGFVAAAIDFPLHGSRNWCGASTDCVMPDGTTSGTCTPFTGGAGQGDAVPPGLCTGGSTPRVFSAPGVNVPSRYFLSANFFRMRDAFRQNLLDVSALTLALSRPPTMPTPAANPFSAVLPAGVVVDPREVYYEGLSLGSIAGTSVMAANPRITRGALTVGGGTFVDIGITSAAFKPDLAPLFSALLHVPSFSFDMVDASNPAFNATVAAGFLKLVNVAKWVMDPGDPINYALHVAAAPLPNLLADSTGATPQAAKDVLGMIAQGDTVVPNAANELLYNLIGGPIIGGPITVYHSTSAANGAVPHSMLATSGTVQNDAATYLLDLTAPPSSVALP